MKVSHLALESKTDSNRDPLKINFALFNGHSMLNVSKVSQYLWYTYACISQYETIYRTLKYLPVITLCMPVNNFVVCQ